MMHAASIGAAIPTRAFVVTIVALGAATALLASY